MSAPLRPPPAPFGQSPISNVYIESKHNKVGEGRGDAKLVLLWRLIKKYIMGKGVYFVWGGAEVYIVTRKYINFF